MRTTWSIKSRSITSRFPDGRWTPRLWHRFAVCRVSNRPSADYHSLSRSIIGQLSVRLWVDYRSMICRLSTDHWSIVRPQWIRIRTHDPKSLEKFICFSNTKHTLFRFHPKGMIELELCLGGQTTKPPSINTVHAYTSQWLRSIENDPYIMH